MNEPEVTPWYRQFWPWLVFSPMIFVVPAGFWMIYISVVTSDGTVTENHYRSGRTLIVSFKEDALAAELQLSAQLQIIDDQVSLRLNGLEQNAPQALSLLFVFDTTAQRDVAVELTRTAGGRYTGPLTEPVVGERSLLLEPLSPEPEWRLHGRAEFPSSMIQTLQPRVR